MEQFRGGFWRREFGGSLNSFSALPSCSNQSERRCLVFSQSKPVGSLLFPRLTCVWLQLWAGLFKGWIKLSYLLDKSLSTHWTCTLFIRSFRNLLLLSKRKYSLSCRPSSLSRRKRWTWWWKKLLNKIRGWVSKVCDKYVHAYYSLYLVTHRAADKCVQTV